MGKLSEEEATAILKKTYKKYVEEPELTTRLENIPKLLAKFDGNYDTMIKKLLQKYAKEAKAKPKKKVEVVEEVPEPEEKPKKKKKKMNKLYFNLVYSVT